MDSSGLEESQTTNESDYLDGIPSCSPQNSIEHDETSGLRDENSDNYLKPTFKNTLQAKKRLQAFALQKQILISPSAKTKPVVCNEQYESTQETSIVGTKPKKENPMDKAKATVEEIELLKKSGFSCNVPKTNEDKRTRRSRSKSSERDFVFRKRDWKVRNYRRSDNARRSPSPTITTAKDKYSEKSKYKYPRNWDEFIRDQWTFEKLSCKDSHFKSKSSNTPNDIFRQLLFDSPSDLIKPYHLKNIRGADITVPYKFLRYTSTKPKIPYNENLVKVKEPYLNRKQVLERTRKDYKAILEKFYSKNSKKYKSSEPMGQRNWYVKNWKDSDSKVLETSIGLSFLLNYSDDEEEEDLLLMESNESIEKKGDGGETKVNSSLKIEPRELSRSIGDSTREKTEYISTKDERSVSPGGKKIRTKSESINEDKKIEETISWTPERKVSISEDMWKVSPEMPKEKGIDKKQDSLIEKSKVKSIPSDDEWAETPERKGQDSEKVKKKKSKKSKHEYSDSDSLLGDKKTKKKKKKLARKKKQREKEKKARKKEKLKTDKLKEKKKQKKKEILKKLKKELEKTEMPIKVKVEKDDGYEEVVSQAEDSKKENEPCQKNLEQKRFTKKEDQIDVDVKKENLFFEKKKHDSSLHKEEKQPEKPPREDEHSDKKKPKKEELTGERTPDTEEYQSNWESDDGISPIAKPGSKKTSRGWESDEEVFERAFSKRKPGDVPFGVSPLLEMPLDIKFPKRSFNRPEKKRSRTRSPEYLDMAKEIKLLEAERINLNKERMQLEMEKIRIHELERKNSMEEMEQMGRKDSSPRWRENREEWRIKEDDIDSTSREKRLKEEHHSKHNDKVAETASSSMNTSKSGIVLSVQSSPEITSTKSPTHTVLESAYQEFMRAVSGGNETNDIVISSDESEVLCQEDSSKKSKVKFSKSQRDRNREKSVEIIEEKILSTTDPKILQEILLPGEIPTPELPAVPVPVPSPKLDLSQKLTPSGEKTIIQTALVQEPPIEIKDTQERMDNQQVSPENSSPKKPFSFSTLIIPKKPLLLERSNWKLDDESDDETTLKDKTIEDIKLEEDIPEQSVVASEVAEKQDCAKVEEKIKEIEKHEQREVGQESERSKRKQSRSPLDTSRNKRRRENSIKRRDNERRRDTGSRRGEEHRKREEEAKRRDRSKRQISPARHREPSPRKRRYSSPIHRRSSPRHRSPPRRPERGERRSSPSAARKRSYSPSKLSRRRSPSPHYNRMSKSPRRSPMEGLKRSVADSTISDDLLPQHYAVDSSSSPLCSSTPAPSSRRMRLTLSPKRPSLDERINQVLGIEKEKEPQHPPVLKTAEAQVDPRQNPVYSGYHHHQEMSSDFRHFQSKVLQVGNIIQVVPSEDFGLPPPRPVQAPMQKILQVGNMLQIVPSEMEPIAPPLPPPLPLKETALLDITVNAIPERRSAESVLEERMGDRVTKRREKEERKKEKEKKRKDKVKKRKMRLKVSTEDMIKRALELDGYIGLENEDLNAMVPEVINNTPGLDPSRSILSSSSSRFLGSERERKSVQFADGIRPGEGTSPSGGEELSSPPPDTLIKPKKYKRLGSIKKKKKRKTKVKVVKKRPLPSPTDSEEEYENLPPPSPPPGSPPPHVFPPRAKVHTLNNIPQHYLSSYGITTAPQTPPVVQPQQRMNLAYQTPPTAIYRTPPPHVIGQHFSRMSHGPPMGMNVPPPPSPIHRDQQTYGSY